MPPETADAETGLLVAGGVAGTPQQPEAAAAAAATPLSLTSGLQAQERPSPSPPPRMYSSSRSGEKIGSV